MEKTVIHQDEKLAPRKAYTKPSLVEYGSIAKLTQSAGSVNGDAGLLMPCL